MFKNRKKIPVIIILIILLIPLWMWIAWLITPKKVLKVVIVDKTVLSQIAQEHASLNWVLGHRKYVKEDGNLYLHNKDYFGFFPGYHHQYKIKGLERFSDKQIDSIARNTDLAYFTDTYGIYHNEWTGKNDPNEHSAIIYGGVSDHDIRLMRHMKENKKLLITEFNTFASPSGTPLRTQVEDLFNIRWSGWIGRYFSKLDSSNTDLPLWVFRNYKAQNNGKWPYKVAGIVFVHESGKIVILEDKTHLKTEMPIITSDNENQKRFKIPEKINYPFWFDVILTSRSNKVISLYELETNKTGDSVLLANGIPRKFPATLECGSQQGKQYYFAGDYADNPISQNLLEFKGIEFFRLFLYNVSSLDDRRGFFWYYYHPMMTEILDSYYSELEKKQAVN